LGIDPGTISMGYGVIEDDGARLTMVACGVFSFSSKTPIEERLCSLHNQLGKMVKKLRPQEVAVEEPFVSENVRTAIAIGRAQAIALLAGAIAGLPVFRYSPAQVKQRVTNYGGSDKKQVQQVVRLQLGLAEPPQPDDAADALAVAICHLQENRVRQLLARHQTAMETQGIKNLRPGTKRKIT